LDSLKIYTDGGCSGNPGPGGWAFIITGEDGASIIAQKYGGEEITTNNRMELTAVISALEFIGQSGAAPGQITVYTDSQYVQKGMKEWIAKWKTDKWRTSAKTPVKNSDLWLRLDSLASGFSIEWVWIEGHAGNALNEAADQMTQMAIKSVSFGLGRKGSGQ